MGAWAVPPADAVRLKYAGASQRNPRVLPGLLRRPWPPHCPELAPGARRRPHAALHQCRDEPVQGRVPGPRAARLPACDHRPEVHARERQAQRSRQCRTFAPAPHVLRDAGQLLVRRLLQARRDRDGLDAADRRSGGSIQAGSIATVFNGESGIPRDDEAYARWRDFLPENQRRRARHGRQLLGHGRYRAMRALLGDLLRPWSGGSRHGSVHRRRRGGQRAVRRDLEQRVHGVRAGCAVAR